MSSGRGGTQVNKERSKLQLQISFLQAVIQNYRRVVVAAIPSLNSGVLDFARSTGPGPLDFTCKQVNEALKNHDRDKLNLEGERKKYMTYSPLMVAVLEGSIDLVQDLIQAKASVAFKNKEGLTALHVACNAGKLDVVDLLLNAAMEQKRFVKKKKLQNDCQCFINAKFRPKGWTPLMYAVKNGHVEIVKRLMECEYLNYNVTNRKKQNIYHIAVREGQLECLEQLCSTANGNPEKHETLIMALKTSDHNNQNIFHQACTQNNITVKWLLDRFKELKIKDCLDQASKKGYTPFLVACEYHNEERSTVKYFIDTLYREGLVDILVKCHQEDGLGTTALHLAALHNKQDLAKVLIEAGCSLEEQDDKGNTVLHVAMQRGNRTVAKFISDTCKAQGVDLESVRNKDGKLPKDVEEEFVIPPEIRKMGSEAVVAYEKALEEGKRKIPYCGMLILGESEVGKTSLYRQLVGKDFLPTLERTKGIDNNTVETMVDERSVTLRKAGHWHEIEGTAGGGFAKAVGEETHKLLPAKKKSRTTDLHDEETLLKTIERIKRDLKPRSLPQPPPQAVHLMPFLTPVPPRPLENYSPETFNPPSDQVVKAPEFVSRERRIAAPPKPTSEPNSVLEAVQEKPKPSKTVHQPQEDTDQSAIATLPPPTAPPRHDPPRRLARGPRKEPVEEEPRYMLTHRDGTIVMNYVKGRTKLDVNEALTLIALDFAGHPEYRPMHHCFISRRACYLVVFKIPDMIKCIDGQCSKTWEEFRYWIHSINAHIYPPDQDEKEKIKRFRRIILVGTHRDSEDQEKLKKIDDFFEEKITCDKRCVNHVRIVKNPEQKPCTKYFIAVENKIDFKTKKDSYLAESGTKAVQDAIKHTSEKLPFLKETYPLKWLKFKERIEAKSASTPVVSMKELLDMASKSRILEEKQQKLAIRFLHESGKIRCLEYLPHLFLSNEERKELEDKVVIRPQWLISVMKEIMKLDVDEDNEGVEKTLVVDFANSGKVDLKLLKMCWKEYLPDPSNPSSGIMELRHLCLLLKAYCLIFPLQKGSDKFQNGENCSKGQSENTNEMDTSTTSENRNDRNFPSCYLVPCKLPEKTIVEESGRKWFSFYFDFNGFLPAEVYHRLLCILLMTADHTCSKFSRFLCILETSKRKSWKIQYKQCEHILEVSVVGSNDFEAELIEVHNHITEICRDSHLEGLKYVGGVKAAICDNCGRKQTLHCVELEEGNSSVRDKVWCSKCKESIEDKQELFKVTLKKSDSKIWDMEINRLAFLHLIKYRDLENSEVKELKILEALAPDWTTIGEFLLFTPAEIKEIQNPGSSKNPTQCIQEVFSRWINNPCNKKYPNNWKGVYTLLMDSSHSYVAKNLKAAIEAPDSDLRCSFQKESVKDLEVQHHAYQQQASPPSQEAKAPAKANEIPQSHAVNQDSADHQVQQQSSPSSSQMQSQLRESTHKSKRGKKNKRQLADWLEENGVDDRDIENLRDKGVNETIFLNMEAGDEWTKDLSTATMAQLAGLQKDLR